MRENTLKENPNLKENQDKCFMAKIVSFLVFLLGTTMMTVCYIQGNKVQTYISIVYSLLFLLAFIQLNFSQNLTFFYVIAFGVAYALEIMYIQVGGHEGFGIIWLTIFPIFTIYMITSTKRFLLFNSIILLYMIIWLWTPLHQYCYQFSATMRIRFPLLFLIEIVFSSAIKLRLSRTEKSYIKIFNDLVDFNINLEEKIQEKNKELNHKNIILESQIKGMMETLAATIDARDKYTSGHSLRVAKYSQEIAKRMGKSKEEQEDIYMMGLLHDIGKIGVKDEIINKIGRLTDEEFNALKEHPSIGYEILKKLGGLPSYIVDGARWHHERWDGKGYPDGLKGEEIPELVRIISVADAYDAMTSNRSYRELLPQEVVRQEIVKGRGTQFDALIASKMIEMIDSDIHYEMHGPVNIAEQYIEI
ncbi:MAG: HD-GYP domain-containing protein [Treponema sp.]|nr:HD-GYP domain-containing protein [Treponema sp.]